MKQHITNITESLLLLTTLSQRTVHSITNMRSENVLIKKTDKNAKPENNFKGSKYLATIARSLNWEQNQAQLTTDDIDVLTQITVQLSQLWQLNLSTDHTQTYQVPGHWCIRLVVLKSALGCICFCWTGTQTQTDSESDLTLVDLDVLPAVSPFLILIYFLVTDVSDKSIVLSGQHLDPGLFSYDIDDNWPFLVKLQTHFDASIAITGVSGLFSTAVNSSLAE